MGDRCVCGYRFIPAVGPKNAKILLVGEYPDYAGVIHNRPIGDEDTLKILRAELARAGISLDECRLTNLWQHDWNDECDEGLHMSILQQEFAGRHILLMGSTLTNLMFNEPVEELSGLTLKHPVYPKLKFHISVHPATAKSGPIGELRHALKLFAEATRNV